MLRANESNDTIPSADWDLSDIYYATSEDGFTREEQGIAVARPEPPKLGCRSVATADILFFKGKYYLYYQAFNVAPGKDGGDYRITSYNVCYTKLLRRILDAFSASPIRI